MTAILSHGGMLKDVSFFHFLAFLVFCRFATNLVSASIARNSSSILKVSLFFSFLLNSCCVVRFVSSSLFVPFCLLCYAVVLLMPMLMQLFNCLRKKHFFVFPSLFDKSLLLL